jgi:tRNA(Arg) A34 adenosine deaminase TadA
VCCVLIGTRGVSQGRGAGWLRGGAQWRNCCTWTKQTKSNQRCKKKIKEEEGSGVSQRATQATTHAEFVAIDELIEREGNSYIFHDCDLYVTVEPCIMCASALLILGFRRVFFGCSNPRFGGCGSVMALYDREQLCDAIAPCCSPHALTHDSIRAGDWVTLAMNALRVCMVTKQSACSSDSTKRPIQTFRPRSEERAC